jgi:chaperonin GroEL
MNRKVKLNENQETLLGYEIILKALQAPIRQIAINAGKEDGSVIIDRIMQSDKENAGYDASADKFVEDMLKVGIIDPVKVTRTAILNASSAAAILLTTEVAITEEQKEEKPAGPAIDHDY